MVISKKIYFIVCITPLIFSCYSKVEPSAISGKWLCKFVPIYGSHKGSVEGEFNFNKDGQFTTQLTVYSDKKKQGHSAIINEHGTFEINQSEMVFNVTNSSVVPVGGSDDNAMVNSLKEGFHAPSTSVFNLKRLDVGTLRMQENENDSEFQCEKAN